MKSFLKIGLVAFVAIFAMSFTLLSKANVLGSKAATAAVVTGCYTSVTLEGQTTAPDDDIVLGAGNVSANNSGSNCTDQVTISNGGTTIPFGTPIKSARGLVTSPAAVCNDVARFCCYEISGDQIISVCYKSL